jgi:hypothetical protein
MAVPTGESKSEALKLDFDRRVRLRFHGSAITSDGGLLAYRELDDVLALTASGGERLAEARTGRNRRHLLVGLRGPGCVALALAPEVFASGLHVGGFPYPTGGGPGPPFEGMIERRNLRISEEPRRLLDRNAIIFEIAKSKAIT